MGLLSVLRTSASALTAQRLRMDVIANNVANAETTRTAEGGPYKRQQVVFRARTGDSRPFALPSFVAARHAMDTASVEEVIGQGVQVEQIVTDDEPGAQVYEPGHPDANEDGFVTYPNVNIVTEMTDMLSATRAYEANVTVLGAIKNMALKALEIGRI